ncbi:hypothetical protein ACJX0J_021492, partial [Zea mays]
NCHQYEHILDPTEILYLEEEDACADAPGVGAPNMSQGNASPVVAKDQLGFTLFDDISLILKPIWQERTPTNHSEKKGKLGELYDLMLILEVNNVCYKLYSSLAADKITTGTTVPERERGEGNSSS